MENKSTKECCSIKKQTKQEAMQQLYDALLCSNEILIIETADIASKGLYLSKPDKKKIYIKQSLSVREKLKVLLHEYSHHIHLTHYYNHETRAQCDNHRQWCGFFNFRKVWVETLWQ